MLLLFFSLIVYFYTLGLLMKALLLLSLLPALLSACTKDSSARLSLDCYDCTSCGTDTIVIGESYHEVDIEYAGCYSVCSPEQTLVIWPPPCDGDVYLHCGEYTTADTAAGEAVIHDPSGSYTPVYEDGEWVVTCPGYCYLMGDHDGHDSTVDCLGVFALTE